MNRFREVPQQGPLCDILWSDPIEEDYVPDLTDEDRQEWYQVGYVFNSMRGCGYVFGYTATKVFLEENNLVGIHVVLLKLKRNSWPLYELMKFKKRATYCTLFTRRTATIRKH